MKTRTLNELRACKPCYDPVRWVPEGWEGTAIDLLNIKECPAEDRILMVIKKGLYYTNKQLRLFACDCAEHALSRIKDPDPRSVAAIEIARRHAEGNAKEEELYAAGYAAGYAAYYAAYYADDYAAECAARCAAYYADDYAEREWQVERLKEYAREAI